MPRVPTEPCIRARRYGAGRPVLSWRWRLGPARFGRYRKPMGAWAVLPYLRPSTALNAHERRLSLSHFLDNALHFLDNAFHFFLEDHQSLLCRLCFGIASERRGRSIRFEP